MYSSSLLESHEVRSDESWRSVAVSFEVPSVVVADTEVGEGVIELGDSREVAQPEKLLLERSDHAEEMGNFALGDALVTGDRAIVLAVAERLLAQGVTAGSTVYSTATSVRRAHKALVRLEEGADPSRLEREMGMPPFLARKLINSLSGTTVESMRDASIAMAELELWTRGGAEYPDELALDLALLAATA